MTEACTIELRVREASHLFDPLDASSFVERDLNHRVEEWIVKFLLMEVDVSMGQS
jgi:hypothetical protein